MNPPRMLKGILTGILTGALALSVLPDSDTPLSDVIVRGTDLDAVAAAVADHGGTVELELDIIDGVSADVPTALLPALTADARTIEVSQDAQVTLLSKSSASSHRGLTADEAAKRLGGGWLGAKGFDGTGIDIAIVDSGIDATALPGTKIARGVNVSFDEQHDDGYGHGTAMAGIIAGNTANFLGTARDARLIDIKVADSQGMADVSQVLAGIDWAVTNRATDGRNIRVLSLAFGTDGTNSAATSPLVYAAEAAWRHGITVVVAAGNHGTELGRLTTPGISPNLITVGAADVNDVKEPRTHLTKVPSWTAAGDGVRNPDFIAPGRSILGGLANNSTIARRHPDAHEGPYLLGSGTSQATAFTAGVVASLLESAPRMSPDDVKATLVRSTTVVSTDSARTGAGVLDLGKLNESTTKVGTKPANTWSDGSGSLDGDRGSYVLENSKGERLTGENTVNGPFDRDAWTKSTWTGSTWTGSTWTGSTWTGSTWTGSTWTGSTWTGSTWTDSTWTSVRWGE